MNNLNGGLVMNKNKLLVCLYILLALSFTSSMSAIANDCAPFIFKKYYSIKVDLEKGGKARSTDGK